MTYATSVDGTYRYCDWCGRDVSDPAPYNYKEETHIRLQTASKSLLDEQYKIFERDLCSPECLKAFGYAFFKSDLPTVKMP